MANRPTQIWLIILLCVVKLISHSFHIFISLDKFFYGCLFYNKRRNRKKKNIASEPKSIWQSSGREEGTSPPIQKKSNLETNERKKTFIYFIAKYCFDFLMLWSGGVGFLGSKTPKTIAPNELE